jgi:lysophospholipase L1-like esterase
MVLSRRNFFSSSVKATAAMASIPAIVSSCFPGKKESTNNYKVLDDNDTILFQGDSITDAGRKRNNLKPNSNRAFGTGYAYIAASKLLNDLPEKKLVIYNRGISGNKVYQLAERWQKDCLDLKPDVLSILIGVNDYWHKRVGKYDGTPDVYENDFMKLMLHTQESIPGIKLVICQPFIVTGTSTVDESWIKPFQPYQESSRRVAQKFDAIWVPFQKVFDKAVEVAEPSYWTPDGVHPSMAGSQLMAEAWLRSVQG